MRTFSSYGPISTTTNYYAPRTALIDVAHFQLVGEEPEEGGHYITVWAPRQAGKSWLMQRVLFRLFEQPEFDVMKLNLENLKQETDVLLILNDIARQIREGLNKEVTPLHTPKEFEIIFTHDVLDKPLILIMDEFDALPQEAISAIAGAFRNIYVARRDDARPSTEKKYLLHGVALIGVRSVLGIENKSGSPFNVQRSLHVPNLRFEEVQKMFDWYQKESGHVIEPAVIERLYHETGGQPGLICWFGELISQGFEGHPADRTQPVTPEDFRRIMIAARDLLPNSNILNILSKVKSPPYNSLILDMFRTGEPRPFRYDDPHLNYLYMNGVIEPAATQEGGYVVKFACPFVQKRIFNYFAHQLFGYTGKLHEPFEDLSASVTDDMIHIPNLMQRFEGYLRKNRGWLLQDAPKRKDLRLYEAVFHFSLYRFLCDFLEHRGARIYPEFPTGNGSIDLIITYAGQRYGLELKSYTDDAGHRKALQQAARYGKQLGLKNIELIVFVEYIDDANRAKYQQPYHDTAIGVTVTP
ncbi:MAG: hypothetical protein GY801_19170, partial [bacterium]|nr:hypothetical protein [bacterium]